MINSIRLSMIEIRDAIQPLVGDLIMARELVRANAFQSSIDHNSPFHYSNTLSSFAQIFNARIAAQPTKPLADFTGTDTAQLQGKNWVLEQLEKSSEALLLSVAGQHKADLLECREWAMDIASRTDRNGRVSLSSRFAGLMHELFGRGQPTKLVKSNPYTHIATLCDEALTKIDLICARFNLVNQGPTQAQALAL